MPPDYTVEIRNFDTVLMRGDSKSEEAKMVDLRKGDRTFEPFRFVGLAGVSEDTWMPWVSTVFAQGALLGAETLSSPEMLEHLGGTSPIVLIYPSADQFLRMCLGEGDSLQNGISRWCHIAEAVLGFYRQNRKSVFLVDADAFAAEDCLFREMLSAWLSVEIKLTAPIQEPRASLTNVDIIANYTTLCAERVRRLSGELEAGGYSPRFATRADLESIGSVFANLGNNANLAAVKKCEPAYQAELELISLQLEASQKQTLAAQHLLEEEHQLRTSLEHKISKLDEKHEISPENLDNSAQYTYWKLQEEVRLREERELELQSVQEHRAALIQSTSWRITRPMRVVRRLFT